MLTSSSLVASNMTTDSSMATVPTSPLPVASKTLANTYYKLTHDKSLNIVYCGGSITGGYGSSGTDAYYSALVTNWLKTHYP